MVKVARDAHAARRYFASAEDRLSTDQIYTETDHEKQIKPSLADCRAFLRRYLPFFWRYSSPPRYTPPMAHPEAAPSLDGVDAAYVYNLESGTVVCTRTPKS